MATIKDVAEITRLSVTTVSRVLNNRGYISKETRDKVYAAMKQINYQPNEVARSLSKQVTKTIGVIVPHINHPYWAEVISNLESQVYLHKYKIIFLNYKEKHEMLKEYMDLCASNRVAGIILCSGTVSAEDVQLLGIPVVMMERYVENGTAVVECDNYSGGGLAAKHLIEKGCKNVMCIGGIMDNEMPADVRTIGFVDICKKYNITYTEATTSMKQYNGMEYHEGIERLLLENPQIDGIFVSSDVIAAQVVQVCAKMNKKIPQEIKLVGFDDVSISRLTTPRITTIHQPIKEMAETAIDVLIRATKGQVVPNRTILPVTLVEREST